MYHRLKINIQSNFQFVFAIFCFRFFFFLFSFLDFFFVDIFYILIIRPWLFGVFQFQVQMYTQTVQWSKYKTLFLMKLIHDLVIDLQFISFVFCTFKKAHLLVWFWRLLSVINSKDIIVCCRGFWWNEVTEICKYFVLQ